MFPEINESTEDATRQIRTPEKDERPKRVFRHGLAMEFEKPGQIANGKLH